MSEPEGPQPLYFPEYDQQDDNDVPDQQGVPTEDPGEETRFDHVRLDQFLTRQHATRCQGDLYTETFKYLFGRDPTKDERRDFKAVMYAYLYSSRRVLG